MKENYSIERAVKNPLEWANLLTPAPDKSQIQPNGVDLKANKIYNFDSSKFNKIPFFSTKSKDGLPLKEFKPTYDEELKGFYWELESNSAYIIEYKEAVKIPEDAMGLFLPRSSLWRLFGALIHTSVWDSGYNGVGRGLLKTTFKFKLEQGTPIGQLILFTAEKAKSYSGSYQGEGLK